MVEPITHTSEESSSSTDRRKFIKTVGGTGIVSFLAGCSSSNGDSEGTTGGSTSKTTSEGTTGGSTSKTTSEGTTGGSTSKTTSEGTTGGSTSKSITITFNSSLKGDVWKNYKQALYESGLPKNIELQHTDLPSANRGQVWEQWLSTGRKKPDIFMVKPFGAPYIKRGYLANVSKRLPDETESMIWDEMPNPLVKMFAKGKTLYGIPFFMDIGTMQYRKDLVKKAGYKPDKKNWATNPLSWKKFSQVISDTLDATDIKYGFGWGTQKGQFVGANFYEWVTSYGGDYFGGVPYDKKVGKRSCTVNEQPAVNALKMGRSFIYGQDDNDALSGISKCSPNAVLQWTDDPPVNNLAGGNLVAVRNWLWSIPQFYEKYGDKIGVMPLPYGVPKSKAKYDGMGGSESIMSGWYIVINTHSKHKQAAAKVLEAIVQDHSIFSLLKYKGYSPSKPKIYKSDKFKNMDVFGNYVKPIQYTANHLAGFPKLNPLWSRENSKFQKYTLNALTQSTTSQKAMNTLSKTIEQFEDQQA